MEYFYHYTTLENWEKIQQEGLTPRKSIGRGSSGSKSTHELASKLATFGFSSPAPKNWSLYNLDRPSAADPHSLLAYLLKCIGENTGEIALLKYVCGRMMMCVSASIKTSGKDSVVTMGVKR